MKAKVAIFIDTGIIGGPGRGVFQVLHHLPPQGLDYVLCGFAYPDPKSTEFIETAQARNLNLRLLRQRFRFDPRLFTQALAIIRQEGCNVIETHGYKDHVLGCLLHAYLGIPWISFSHGWTTEDWKVRLYHAADSLTLRYSNVALAVSPQLLDSLVKIRGSQRDSRLILNAVDVDDLSTSPALSSIRQSLGLDPDSFLFGCFGRLSPEKGQSVLLAAFAQAFPGPSKTQLIFVGDGSERRVLVEQVEALGLSEHVHFVGYQRNIGDYYAAIDALVLPSLSEGLPNVVLEAMALGVPVIATRVGAVDLIIDAGVHGELVTAGDPVALADGLRKVERERSAIAAMAIRGREKVLNNFSPQTRAKAIFELYQTVAGLGARGRY